MPFEFRQESQNIGHSCLTNERKNQAGHRCPHFPLTPFHSPVGAGHGLTSPSFGLIQQIAGARNRGRLDRIPLFSSVRPGSLLGVEGPHPASFAQDVRRQPTAEDARRELAPASMMCVPSSESGSLGDYEIVEVGFLCRGFIRPEQEQLAAFLGAVRAMRLAGPDVK